MRTYNIKNLKPFPPGVSGNPSGKPKKQLPEGLRDIESLTQREVVKLISKYARMTRGELAAAELSAKATALELAFVSIFNKSIEDGDFTRVSFLLDRCIGKAPQVVEDEDERQEREVLGRMSLNELLTFVQSNLPEAS